MSIFNLCINVHEGHGHLEDRDWIKKGTLLSLVNEGDIVTVIPVCICHKISQEHLHGFS